MRFKIATLALLAGFCLVNALGCGRSKNIPQGSKRESTTFLVFFDTSGSETTERKTQASYFLNACVDRLSRGTDSYVLYGFSTGIQKYSLAMTPRRIDDPLFTKVLDEDIIQKPPMKDDPGTMFVPVAEEILQQKDPRIVVLILTSGGFSDRAELKRALPALVAAKNVLLVAVGPLTTERAGSTNIVKLVENDFRGLSDRGKFVAFTKESQSQALKEVERCLYSWEIGPREGEAK